MLMKKYFPLGYKAATADTYPNSQVNKYGEKMISK